MNTPDQYQNAAKQLGLANAALYQSIIELHQSRKGIQGIVDSGLCNAIRKGLKGDAGQVIYSNRRNIEGSYYYTPNGKQDDQMQYRVAGDSVFYAVRREYPFDPKNPKQIKVGSKEVNTIKKDGEMLSGMEKTIAQKRAELESALMNTKSRLTQEEKETVSTLLTQLYEIKKLNALKNGHWRTPFSNEGHGATLNYVKPIIEEVKRVLSELHLTGVRFNLAVFVPIIKQIENLKQEVLNEEEEAGLQGTHHFNYLKDSILYHLNEIKADIESLCDSKLSTPANDPFVSKAVEYMGLAK